MVVLLVYDFLTQSRDGLFPAFHIFLQPPTRLMTGFTFGDVRYIDPDVAGIALVVTVIFLALCEHATHCLEIYIQHSPIYMTMLQKIYKELMIMGKKFALSSSPYFFFLFRFG